MARREAQFQHQGTATEESRTRVNLKRLWSEGRQPDTILVREGFVARAVDLTGDLSDRHPPNGMDVPPLARLISPRGAALRLELDALFVAQCMK